MEELYSLVDLGAGERRKQPLVLFLNVADGFSSVFIHAVLIMPQGQQTLQKDTSILFLLSLKNGQILF